MAGAKATPKDAHYRECLEKVRQAKPSLLDPSEPIDPEGLQHLQLWLLHLHCVDMLRGEFALARRWAQAAYLGSIDDLLRCCSAIETWPAPAPNNERLPFHELMAREVVVAPLLRWLWAKPPFTSDETRLMSDGLRYTGALWEEGLAGLRERPAPKPVELRNFVSLLSARALYLAEAAWLVGDKEAASRATHWRQEVEDVIRSAPGTHAKWVAPYADHPELDPLRQCLAGNQTGYISAFGVRWNLAAKRGRYPFNVRDKTAALAIHLWAQQRFGKPVSVEAPVGLRGFDWRQYYVSGDQSTRPARAGSKTP